MNSSRVTLYIYTNTFPFGEVGEYYLAEELSVLSSCFDSIVILPLIKNGECLRDLPANVTINEALINDINNKLKFSKLSYPDKFQFLQLFLKELIQSSSKWQLIKSIRDLGYLYTKACEICEVIKKESDNDSVIHYSYWFDFSSLGLALAKKRKIINYAVSRAHGYDLYDFRSKLKFQPFRFFKVQQLNGVFPVSKMGANYFKSKVPKKYGDKIFNAYLGVNNSSDIVTESNSIEKNIVTCSTVVTLKRLSILLNALCKIEEPVKWIHIGDGSELERLQNESKKLPSNIKVEWKGRLSNEDVFNFYNHQWVDLFVNCSYSEGLPVSMMEASSFGIPILSFNVGGVSEIVTNETGYLVQDKDDVNGFNLKLKEVLSSNTLDRRQIRYQYEKHFDANKNYIEFAQVLKAFLNKSKS